MKLPALKGHISYYPKKGLCPWCRQNKVFEPHSFAVLRGGALLMDRKSKSGGPDDGMDGFLDIIWHGAHEGGVGKDKGIEASLDIAQDVRGGQFELYFCSTKCLRSYLNYCVDELERKLTVERHKFNKMLKRTAIKKRPAPLS